RDPRTKAWPRANTASRVKQQVLRAVQRRFSHQRSDNAKIVRPARDMREQIADPQPRFATLFKIPGTGEPLSRGTDALRTRVRLAIPHALAVLLREFRLGIERINMRHAPVH